VADQLWLMTRIREEEEEAGVEGNLHPHCSPREYIGEYTSRGKPKIPPVDRILMDPCHIARKNPSDNADLNFQAVGPALCIMQLNVEGLSAAKHHIIYSRIREDEEPNSVDMCKASG